MREYLTAEWFAELLKNGASRRNIEALFFRKKYDLDIVVPTLRPLLPWLVISDENIRRRVRKIAPEIFFEGGDPSQLPVKFRSDILQEICAKMATGERIYSVQYYESILCFANPDLAAAVRNLLQQYVGYEHLTAFLLDIVWHGQIREALPEVMEVALNPTAHHRAREAAFKALNSIASNEDQEQVRQHFLAESLLLGRVWLAALLNDIEPTEQTTTWLLACLGKCEPIKQTFREPLTVRVTAFVDTADIDLLLPLVIGLNKLLDISITSYYSKLSKECPWLLVPACKAVERLIKARHVPSLRPETLELLLKFSAVHNSWSIELRDVETNFSQLVPEWKEFNRALFWHAAQKWREAWEETGKRVVHIESFSWAWDWSFEEGDFEYAVNEISHQTHQDNKMVALSLAFKLYKEAHRPRAWRLKLKKLVVGNDELTKRLADYLIPPAQSDEKREENQWLAKNNRRVEAERKKQEKHHADWKKRLNENLDEFRATLSENPGSFPDSLQYLWKQTEQENKTVQYWTALIPEYGKKVARYYRDGIVSYWRHHEPKWQSEGTPLNKTPDEVDIGLIGLWIEAGETKDWPKTLSTTEVECASKYACFNLKMRWVSELFETHSEIVCDIFMKEIRYELLNEGTGFIDRVSDTAPAVWNQLAPSICEALEKTEPKTVSNLIRLHKILQQSNISDDKIARLATAKCRTLRDSEHVVRWLAVWTGVAPDAGIKCLKTRIADSEGQAYFAEKYLNSLWGIFSEAPAREAFKTPEHLKALHLLSHEYLQSKEDINYTGAGFGHLSERQGAQTVRDELFSMLCKIPGKEAGKEVYLALKDIAEKHPVQAYQPGISLRAKEKAEQDGDIAPWEPSKVAEFQKNQTLTPSNHSELAELAESQLLDLKDELEDGDTSNASILLKEKEVKVRNYIANHLRKVANMRYTISQENELADGKRPDLRFERPNIAGVPVELKLANKWSGPTLFERLENQLCRGYLRDVHSRHGIFLLVNQGKEGWKTPGSHKTVDFDGLTTALQDKWEQITSEFSGIDGIRVIGIDLTKRNQ